MLLNVLCHLDFKLYVLSFSFCDKCIERVETEIKVKIIENQFENDKDTVL